MIEFKFEFDLMQLESGVEEHTIYRNSRVKYDAGNRRENFR